MQRIHFFDKVDIQDRVNSLIVISGEGSLIIRNENIKVLEIKF